MICQFSPGHTLYPFSYNDLRDALSESETLSAEIVALTDDGQFAVIAAVSGSSAFWYVCELQCPDGQDGFYGLYRGLSYEDAMDVFSLYIPQAVQLALF